MVLGLTVEPQTSVPIMLGLITWNPGAEQWAFSINATCLS